MGCAPGPWRDQANLAVAGISGLYARAQLEHRNQRVDSEAYASPKSDTECYVTEPEPAGVTALRPNGACLVIGPQERGFGICERHPADPRMCGSARVQLLFFLSPPRQD